MMSKHIYMKQKTFWSPSFIIIFCYLPLNILCLCILLVFSCSLSTLYVRIHMCIYTYMNRRRKSFQILRSYWNYFKNEDFCRTYKLLNYYLYFPLKNILLFLKANIKLKRHSGGQMVIDRSLVLGRIGFYFGPKGESWDSRPVCHSGFGQKNPVLGPLHNNTIAVIVTNILSLISVVNLFQS